jgi:exodeoxyribonuclease VII small subunit
MTFRQQQQLAINREHLVCIALEYCLEFELPKFEECLQRLEQIVNELERGDVPLEKALGLFEEGMQLSASCRKELDEAEGKVEILVKKNGRMQTEPFESNREANGAHSK